MRAQAEMVWARASEAKVGAGGQTVAPLALRKEMMLWPVCSKMHCLTSSRVVDLST